MALGVRYPEVGARMEPLGDAFIKAIRVLIAPIIFCTVVHGIASMANMAKVGRVALKALIYFEVLTTIALIIGLVAVNLFQPGAGMHVDLSHVDTSSVAHYLEQTQKRTTAQFLLNIIPNTFVGAFSEGNVLQVLFVSVLCGFALSWMGPAGKPLTDLIEIAAQMFFRIVGFVMWAAPIGAFGAIAFTVGKFGAGSLLSLGKLVVSFYITCLVFIFAVLWPISHWCGFSLIKFIRYIREELLIVIATTSSETVLAAHDRQARGLGVRGKRGRARHSDRLFVQPRRHLPLPGDRGGIFGAGDRHAAHLGAPDRIALGAAVGLKGRSRRCRRRFHRACRDAWARSEPYRSRV